MQDFIRSAVHFHRAVCLAILLVLSMFPCAAFAQTITVTSPNGGETWFKQATYNITWSTTGGVGNVLIHLYRGGTNVLVISASTTNDGLFSWTVPTSLTAASDYRIGMAETDGSPSDFSNNFFTIANATITVTSPNGGENWRLGETRTITWTTTPGIGNVLIHLYLGSTMVQSLAAGDPNDGTFTWTISGSLTPASNYRIGMAEASDSDPSDFSNTNFTLSSPTIAVSVPNGGENWPTGTSQQIQWTSSGTFTSFDLHVSRDGGSNWSVIETGLPGNFTFRNWIVTSPTSTSCRIRVTGNIPNGFVQDMSNSNFTISSPASITVNTPNGGESWQVGTSYNIAWSTTGSVGNVLIHLYRGGTNVLVISASTANDGQYSWTVPAGLGTGSDYRIGMAETDGAPSDFSDNFFTITNPLVTLTAPAGGENWQIGTSHRTQWINTGSFNSFDLHISRDGGSNWSVIETGLPGNFTFRDWTVTSPVSTSCKFRVTGNYTGGATSSQNGPFFAIIGSVNVTFPTGGSTLWKGHSYTVTWNSQHITGNVRVIALRNGVYYYPLCGNCANTGSQSFEVPFGENQTPGYDWPEDGNYQIMVDAVNGTGGGTSGSFSILRPTIAVTFPNGGQTMYRGQNINVTWSQNQVEAGEPILLQWYRGDTPGQLLTASAPNIGSYSWAIPANFATGTDYRIGISAYVGEVWDYSNGYNTISDLPLSITVTSPNGGENWSMGQTRNITWTTTGPVGNVAIHLYRNSSEGPMVCSIAAGEPNTGNYAWTIPPEIESHTDYLIGISQASSGDPWDFSNAWFTINGASLTLNSPDGNETLTMGQPWQIQWTSVGSVSTVHVELYQGNPPHGSPLRVLHGGAPNTGSLLWNPVDIDLNPACNYYIGISDNGNGNLCNATGDPWDYSNLAFCIQNSQESITVTSPVGGDNWTIGEPHTITWSSTGSVGNVQIHLYRSGTQPENIVDGIAAGEPNDGSLTWTIPALYPPANDYYIGISEVGTGDPWDFTDAPFAISGQAYPLPTTPVNGQTLVGPPYTFQWAQISGANQYKLKVATNDQMIDPEVYYDGIDGSQSSWSYSNFLEWGREHFWQIQGVFGSTEGLWSPVESFVPVGTEVDPPALITPVNGGSVTRMQTFSWSAVPGSGGYRLHIYSDLACQNEVFQNIYGPSTTSSTISIPATIPDFEDGHWRMRSVDPGNGRFGDWSELRSFVLQGIPAPPGTPNALSPNGTTVSVTPVTFNWSPASQATQYVLQYSFTASFMPASLWPDISGTSVSVPLALVAAPRLMYWRVAGINSAGQGAWSTARSFTYDAIGTTPLTSIRVTAPETGVSLRPNTLYHTSGLATGNYSGNVTFVWRIDGSVSSTGNAPMSSNTGAMIPGCDFVTGSVGENIGITLEVCAGGNCLSSANEIHQIQNASYGLPYRLALSANPVTLPPGSSSAITITVVDSDNRRVWSDNGRVVSLSSETGHFANSSVTVANGTAVTEFQAPAVSPTDITITAVSASLSGSIVVHVTDVSNNLQRHDAYIDALEEYGYTTSDVEGWVNQHIRNHSPSQSELEDFQRLMLTEELLAHALGFYPGQFPDNETQPVYGVDEAFGETSAYLGRWAASVVLTWYRAVNLVRSLPEAVFRLLGLGGAWEWFEENLIERTVNASERQFLRLVEAVYPPGPVRGYVLDGVSNLFATLESGSQSLVGDGPDFSAAVEEMMGTGARYALRGFFRRGYQDWTQPILQTAYEACQSPSSYFPATNAPSAFTNSRQLLSARMNVVESSVAQIDAENDMSDIEDIGSRFYNLRRSGNVIADVWAFFRAIWSGVLQFLDGVLGFYDQVQNLRAALRIGDQAYRQVEPVLTGYAGQAYGHLAMLRYDASEGTEVPIDVIALGDPVITSLHDEVQRVEPVLNGLQSAIIAQDTGAIEESLSQLRIMESSIQSALNESIAPILSAAEEGSHSIAYFDTLLSSAYRLEDQVRRFYPRVVAETEWIKYALSDSTANVDSSLALGIGAIDSLRNAMAVCAAQMSVSVAMCAGLQTKPVLAVSSVTVPDSIVCDEAFTITANVRNIGQSMIEPGLLNIYFGRQALILPDSSRTINPLFAGDSVLLQFFVTFAQPEMDSVSELVCAMTLMPNTQEGFSLSAHNTLLLHVSRGPTVAFGNIGGPWRKRLSPYLVEGDCIVPSASTLTIEPGVEVKFAGDYKITIQGTLIADGTEQDSIRFWYDTTAAPGQWSGLRFIKSQAENMLDHCVFLNAANPYPDSFYVGGAVFVDSSLLAVSNCRFENNRAAFGGAIGLFRPLAGSRIDSSTFIRNQSITFAVNQGYGGALSIRANSLTVRHCVFKDNFAHTGAAFATILTTVEYAQCTFADNQTEIDGSIGNTIQGSSVINSCIVVGNGVGSAFFNDSTAVLSARSSCFADRDGELVNVGLPVGFGELISVNVNGDSADVYSNIFANPEFTDSLNFLLMPSSPCRDIGDESLPCDRDFSTADIGANSYFSPWENVPPHSMIIKHLPPQVIVAWQRPYRLCIGIPVTYHVYRAPSPDGPFIEVGTNNIPVYWDTTVDPMELNVFYQVTVEILE